MAAPRITVDAKGLAAEVERGQARAVTGAVTDATLSLKADLRAATASAFSGNRLPMAWRSKVYPSGQDSADAAGWVEVRHSAAAIIETALKATVIRAKGGTWLAIPTEAAGKFGVSAAKSGFGTTVNTRGARERITPGGFERRTGIKLRFVFEKGGRRAFLVADAAMLGPGRVARQYRSKGRGSRLYGPAGQTFVVFTLVPQITTRKRMDLDDIANRAGSRMPGLIVSHWSRS